MTWNKHWSSRNSSLLVQEQPSKPKAGAGNGNASNKPPQNTDTGATPRGQQPKGELLLLPEAAKFVRLAPKTLDRLRGSGGGPRFVKLGPGRRSRVAYWTHDLLDWLSNSEFDSTSEY